MWCNLVQTELTPGPLGNLGIGALAVWAMVMIVDKLLTFFKKEKPDQKDDSSLRTEWRLTNLDKRVDECVTRAEYESSRRDMREQLNRIESKLDNMWGSRRIFTGEKDP